ncbi:MAG: hypothetical protein GXX90_01690 [Microbacteriaceae bacterium]|nr:hypothetical protein [Microbacteriaceae bacterium]
MTAAHDPAPGAGIPALDRLAEYLAGRFDKLYGSLRVMAVNYVALLEPRFGAAELGPFDHGDIVRMRDLSYMVLDSHPKTFGAGVVFDLDRIAASDQTIQWHVRGDDGYEPYGFVYDGDSPEFYDYIGLPWFDEPKRTGEPVLAGPYLDFLGVDEYILTASVPFEIGHRFAGTASSDIEVRTIERMFLEQARGIDADIALTNLEGRIVCTNSSRFLPGETVDESTVDLAFDLPTRSRTLRAVAAAR